MTKAKPGAFQTCACGNRMRASNKTGKCGRCRQREMNAQHCKRYGQRRAAKNSMNRAVTPHAVWIDMSVTLARDAMEHANRTGHFVPAMDHDTEPASYVGECYHCGGYVAVDASEDPQVYGRAYEHPCPGTPPAPAPAIRRDPMTEPTSFTSLSSEPADYDPPAWKKGSNPWASEEKERWA